MTVRNAAFPATEKCYFDIEVPTDGPEGRTATNATPMDQEDRLDIALMAMFLWFQSPKPKDRHGKAIIRPKAAGTVTFRGVTYDRLDKSSKDPIIGHYATTRELASNAAAIPSTFNPVVEQALNIPQVTHMGKVTASAVLLRSVINGYLHRDYPKTKLVLDPASLSEMARAMSMVNASDAIRIMNQITNLTWVAPVKR